MLRERGGRGGGRKNGRLLRRTRSRVLREGERGKAGTNVKELKMGKSKSNGHENLLLI